MAVRTGHKRGKTTTGGGTASPQRARATKPRTTSRAKTPRAKTQRAKTPRVKTPGVKTQKRASPKGVAKKVVKKVAKKVVKKTTKKRVSAKRTVRRPSLPFTRDEYVIYPTHGLGRVLDICREEIGGKVEEFFVVEFEHSRMTLRVPTSGTQVKNMRKISGVSVVGKAFAVLRKAARVQRTMWSRRAQQYEAKINSGSLVSLAEVVRDLYRTEEQPESSYSERQLFQEALDRMTREVAVVQKIGVEQVKEEVHHVLAGSVPVAQSDRATAS